MKKTLSRICACILAVMVFAVYSLSAEASKGDYSYSYTYDVWKDVQDCPDFYSVTTSLTSAELGLDKNLKTPGGLYAYGNSIYVLDTGNNRIVEFVYEKNTLKFKREISSFNGKGKTEVETLSGPTDMAISEDGNIFIADQGNARILKLDSDLNYLLEFGLPNDNTIDQEGTFKPSKFIVDTAERVYCCASGINKGLVKYEADGTFSGFVGAMPVSFNYVDYLWKKLFYSQEQLEKVAGFAATEYNNLYVDKDGFIYVVKTENEADDLKSESINPVRKINLIGNDILIRNGLYPIYGDLFMGRGGGYSGPSKFADITVLDNDIYVCCDVNRGRMFGYNEQGQLVFAFGGNGSVDGYFKRANSIEHIGYTLFVLDYTECSITIFNTTEYGQLVFDAMALFDQGEYDSSAACWEKVLQINGNYDIGYIGIGRALLRQEKYKEAMRYFELKYDDENYSKAYKQYRKEWVEEHIVIIVIVIAAAFLIPGIINKVKKIKYEIATADIFKA